MLVYFMDHVVAPVLAGEGDISQIQDILNEALVLYLTQKKGLSTSEAGAHLGRHANWVTGILGQGLKRREGQARFVPSGITNQVGAYVAGRHPDAVGVSEVADTLKIGESKVLAALDALVKTGKIQAGGSRYRAPGPVIQHHSDKRQKLIESMEAGIRIGERYIAGDPDTVFARIEAYLLPVFAKLALEKSAKSTDDVITEVTLETRKGNSDGFASVVPLRGYLCLEIGKNEGR